MEYHSSLIVANKLLKEIKKQLGKKDTGNNLTIYAYNNTREQGYSIVCYHNQQAVNFSKDRNSDEILVCYGNYIDDFGDNNMLSEEAFKDFKNHRKYFQPEQYKESAKFIINFLLNEGVK